MKKCFFLFIISGCVLSVKSHILKAVILAILGLAGLWLIHLLAQDYQQIQRPTKKWLFKRSTDNQILDYSPKWSAIWAQDPIGCARSFICQLAASEATLDGYSALILDLARTSLSNESWAIKELRYAISLGESIKDANECFKTYKFCPFSARTMLKILTMFNKSP